MRFAETLKKARAEEALTIERLSQITKVPIRTLEDWEAGRREPAKYTQEWLMQKIYRDDSFMVKISAKEKDYKQFSKSFLFEGLLPTEEQISALINYCIETMGLFDFSRDSFSVEIEELNRPGFIK